jgi:hypothetical protein
VDDIQKELLQLSGLRAHQASSDTAVVDFCNRGNLDARSGDCAIEVERVEKT